MRTTLSASSLTGDNVVNREGKKLGDIKDVMLDTRNGRIAYAVLSFGGFLGMGDKLFAIPWQKLQLDEANQRMILDVDEKTLKNAEGFDSNDWPDMADPKFRDRTYKHYGAEPYWH